ncbi:MAG: aspartate/glutamate racemase family protein [Lachnospiraceae bacterium]|nr:aspartate/glutamate racemase family protein [Lachnospiraceae bacterium]
MKTIGLIGGMSWESTIPYYKIINEYMGRALGGLHNARIILYSVEFSELEDYMTKGEWDRIEVILSDVAEKLEAAGAEVILICTNTMHKLYPNISEKVSVPVIHIADATGKALKEAEIKKVALLGTKYTMTGDFYRSRLNNLGFEVLIPEGEDINTVNDIIFKELCRGIIKDESRNAYSKIIDKLKDRGAEGVILGCTEIGSLIGAKDSSLPIFDTTIIHAESAAKYALE